MKLYFYVIHVFLPNTASFQVPFYIEAADSNTAKSISDGLKTDFEKQFEVLFPPSDPVPVFANVNESRFVALISQINQQNSVTIHLPQGFSSNVYQHNKTGGPLKSLMARIMVPGHQSQYYSL